MKKLIGIGFDNELNEDETEVIIFHPTKNECCHFRWPSPFGWSRKAWNYHASVALGLWNRDRLPPPLYQMYGDAIAEVV